MSSTIPNYLSQKFEIDSAVEKKNKITKICAGFFMLK